jgi:hypothetical protein
MLTTGNASGRHRFSSGTLGRPAELAAGVALETGAGRAAFTDDDRPHSTDFGRAGGETGPSDLHAVL